jgi:hypothetical protein
MHRARWPAGSADRDLLDELFMAFSQHRKAIELRALPTTQLVLAIERDLFARHPALLASEMTVERAPSGTSGLLVRAAGRFAR